MTVVDTPGDPGELSNSVEEAGQQLDDASATGMTSRIPRDASAERTEDARDAPGPPLTGQAPDAWCETLGEAAPAARCAEAETFARNLKAGQGGLSVPERMYVGDTVEVSFAIVAPPAGGSSAAPTMSMSDALGAEPSAEGKVRTSRYMAAVLEGANFTITPAGRQQKDLGVTGAQRWTWQVTARDGATHALTLSVYAVMPAADGKPTDNLIQVLSRPVRVEVRWLPAVTQRIADVTGLTGGMAKLLTALGGLIGAAGGIWAAVRMFGRKPPAS